VARGGSRSDARKPEEVLYPEPERYACVGVVTPHHGMTHGSPVACRREWFEREKATIRLQRGFRNADFRKLEKSSSHQVPRSAGVNTDRKPERLEERTRTKGASGDIASGAPAVKVGAHFPPRWPGRVAAGVRQWKGAEATQQIHRVNTDRTV